MTSTSNYTQTNTVLETVKCGKFVQNSPITINHKGADAIIAKQVSKCTAIAKINGLEPEDLRAFSIMVFYEFHKDHCDNKPLDELTPSDLSYFNTTIKRMLRAYASRHVRTRSTDEDGKTVNQYLSLFISFNENQEFENIAESEEGATSEGYMDYFNELRPMILSDNQNDTVNAYLLHDGNITQTAAYVGKTRQAVQKTLAAVKKRFETYESKAGQRDRKELRDLRDRLKLLQQLRKDLDACNINEQVAGVINDFIYANLDDGLSKDLMFGDVKLFEMYEDKRLVYEWIDIHTIKTANSMVELEDRKKSVPIRSSYQTKQQAQARDAIYKQSTDPGPITTYKGGKLVDVQPALEQEDSKTTYKKVNAYGVPVPEV